MLGCTGLQRVSCFSVSLHGKVLNTGKRASLPFHVQTRKGKDREQSSYRAEQWIRATKLTFVKSDQKKRGNCGGGGCRALCRGGRKLCCMSQQLPVASALQMNARRRVIWAISWCGLTCRSADTHRSLWPAWSEQRLSSKKAMKALTGSETLISFNLLLLCMLSDYSQDLCCTG